MANAQWQKVREIFDSALLRQPNERRSFVNEVCGDDQTLRAEVESLLLSHDSAESFMETPAVAKVAGIIEAETKKLAAGKRFGHYEIIKQIGEGGMGQVYLAKDTKLDRKVAIKILNEEFSQDESNLQRFVSEAKAASALNHPNILTIYEFGETEDARFIVSEHIEGKTLREIIRASSLRLPEILDISIQITSALAAAHKAHLVHRDIKPENIIVRPDGYVKVLDFGLAKLVEQKNKSILGSEEPTVRQNLTAKGVIVGTVNYMSPEQAKGERVDERTDIFSLGVMLYEMLAGKPPFAGGNAIETMGSILNKEPVPLSRHMPDVPREIERIINKTLRKNLEERYQTAKDVLIDLRDFKQDLEFSEKLERSAAPSNNVEAGAGKAAVVTEAQNVQTISRAEYILREIKEHKRGVSAVLAILLLSVMGLGYWFYSNRAASNNPNQITSIAVLPLKPINTANRDEVYEIGIADSLIHRLGSMKGFIVRPLSAIRKYADIEQDPIAAGKEQQVDYVLASNYQLAGGKIRITAQLLNVASGQIEETYKSEKDAGDVFAMQDAIAGDVGNILSARFGGTSSGATVKRGTTSEEAYRLYLQGIYLNDKRTSSDSRKAVEAFEQAIRLDPNYARAWAGKAHAHRSFSNFGSRATNVHVEHQQSMEAINKALELDQNLSEAYSVLCENRMYYEYNFAGAEAACKRAIELKPDSPQAHNIYARFLMGPGRRFDDAITEIKTAIDLDPAAYYHQAIYKIVLTYARRYDESDQQLERLAAMNPNVALGMFWYVGGVEMQGNNSETFERLMRFQILAKTDEQTRQLYKTAYQTSGWQGVLRERAKWLQEYNLAHSYFSACVNAQIGDKDKAFEYLEKSYKERELWMAYLQVDPRLDSLRDDPRFDELVRRVGI